MWNRSNRGRLARLNVLSTLSTGCVSKKKRLSTVWPNSTTVPTRSVWLLALEITNKGTSSSTKLTDLFTNTTVIHIAPWSATAVICSVSSCHILRRIPIDYSWLVRKGSAKCSNGVMSGLGNGSKIIGVNMRTIRKTWCVIGWNLEARD